jgi:hypothetical protein
MFLDYCLNYVQFGGGGSEHHIWKVQTLFFHLHIRITCYYKYAIGLKLLAIK